MDPIAAVVLILLAVCIVWTLGSVNAEDRRTEQEEAEKLQRKLDAIK